MTTNFEGPSTGLVDQESVTTLLPAPDREIPVFDRIADGANPEVTARRLRVAANGVRRRAIQTIVDAGAGHVGGEFSITDALVTLYLKSMNVTPEMIESQDPERDRLILSKGHAANTLYTTLAAAGYIHPTALRTFLQPRSMLNGHPARGKIRAVEANTGPLGHGLPIAVGTALAARMDGSARKTFVLLGDGEMQEGSNWEALMTAAHQKLDHLVALVDRNHLQQGASVEDTNDLDPLEDKLTAFGWNVVEVDGHDHLALADAFESAPTVVGKPTFIIAHTHKGHPISYMSGNVAWHHKVPSEQQLETALAELDALIAADEEGARK